MAENVATLLPSMSKYIHYQQNEREPGTADRMWTTMLRCCQTIPSRFDAGMI